MMKPICTTLFSAVAALLLATLGQAQAASTGIAGGDLGSRIDGKIEATMAANDIPGMTVAATVNGRLVYSKGFGFARAEGNKIQMSPIMRTRIGSVSKVVVTSPAAFKLLKQKGINPKTKTLYGPGSVFGDRFKNDIRLGALRFSPIVGTAINKSDRTYTWYVNGTVSIGSTSDLDRHQAPRPFKLPSGRLVSDIRDIAISNSDRVYAYYNDGTLSVGRSLDLGSRQEVVLGSDGKPFKVKFPSGKDMFDVVGIAIAKTGTDADHVYVWYEDGTLSSGTTRDFTAHFTGRRYAVTAGSPYAIRSMAISAKDRVYTWLANGKAQSGSSRDLGKHRAPYGYALPPQGRVGGPDDRQKWAHDITLQHLLDHEAGFQGGGATENAKVMFGKSDETITYELVHRHFLRTRPLRWAPGGASDYSNHGFGLWTIIIEALSGKTYRSYAIDDYLKPLGLFGAIRPLTTSMDEFDAFPHEIRNGNFRVAPAKTSTLGLAAGGWTASAPNLLRITDHLSNSYSQQDLQEMGWARNSKGKLSHNGKTKGGTAYVVMYPDGYHGGGQDVGGIHIALASNIWTSASALSSLASKIAVEVAKSNIDESFDLWNVIQ